MSDGMDLYSLAGLSSTTGTPATSSTPQPTFAKPTVVAKSAFVPAAVKASKSRPAKPKPAAAPTLPQPAEPAPLSARTNTTTLGAFSWSKDIANVYNPAQPNDFDEWRLEREAAKKAAELESALQAKHAEASRKLSSLTAGLEAARGPPSIAGRGGGGLAEGSSASAADASAAAARPLPPPPPPPPSEAMVPPPPAGRGRGGGAVQPAWMAAPDPDPKRQCVSQPASQPAGAREEPAVGGSAGGADAADAADADPGLSMLVRMGWHEGQGLGKDGQGMRTPLVAKKTDAATAVIMNAAERPLAGGAPPPLAPPPRPPPPPAAEASGPAKGAITFRGRPSRVLLLKNMVGAGEVCITGTRTPPSPATPNPATRRSTSSALESLS